MTIEAIIVGLVALISFWTGWFMMFWHHRKFVRWINRELDLPEKIKPQIDADERRSVESVKSVSQ